MALYHKYDVLQNTRGDSLVGYQVVVRQTGGGSIVPIFADPSGTPIVAVSGLPNVALTDDAGNWSIYVDTGTYDIEFRSPQGAFLKAIRNVPFQNGQDGQKGDPGSQPMVDEFVATDGQTTFQPTFQYAPEAVVVFLNGVQIGASDYTALGNDAPLVFDDGLIAGTKVSFHSFVAGGSGGTAPTPALDELSLSDFPRLAGDDAVVQIGPDRPRLGRMVVAANTAQKAMFAPPGTYSVWENGQANVPGTQGLISVDDFSLRGAGADVTIFQGTPDVNYVLYGNRQPSGTVQNPSITEPGSANSIKRVELSGFTIRQPGSFLESSAAIGLFGCTDVHIHDIKGYGWQGDFIRISMAEIGDGSQQGHNRNVLLERIYADGINKNTRQFLTVEDIDTITARDITVLNATRPGNGNQTPQDRNDPNTGPPMPGASDIEFISGSIFDVRARRSLYERWLVVNNGGAALVYNFAKGNRTSPPFPTSGTNAADIAVLISDHKARQITVDQARLGLVTADAPPQAAVGFGVDIDGFYCSNAGRSYEITRFRGMRIANGTFYRSKMAGGMGYVIDDGYYVRDVSVEYVTWEQSGLDDGLCESIYQCDGLTYVSPKVVNSNGTWLRLGGQYGTIKNLTISNLAIQNDGIAGLPSVTASIIYVPQSGETLLDGINRQLDLKTIRITARSWGGAQYPNFAWPEGIYPSSFRHGSWDANVNVFCSSNDTGAPIGWRTAVATTLPAKPRPIPYGVKGLPAADQSLGYSGNTPAKSAMLRDSGGGRFTSLDENQELTLDMPFDVSTASGGAQWIFRGAYDRTSMLFVGFRPRGMTTPGLTGFHGVWLDGGYGGTQQRVARINGGTSTLQGAFSHEQFTRVRIYQSNVFGPVLRVYTGASATGPWTPAGGPIALTGQTNDLVGYVLFGACGESVNLVQFKTATGNDDA